MPVGGASGVGGAAEGGARLGMGLSGTQEFPPAAPCETYIMSLLVLGPSFSIPDCGGHGS